MQQLRRMHEMPGEDERLFVRVVDAGSLKAAAEQLGADPSTISRRLSALEARLGVKLLQRSTRRSTPTDAGKIYVEGLRRLIEQEQALEGEIAGGSDTPRGRLRVTAPVDFGARFVVPVINALHLLAPKLEIELVLGSGFLDLAEQGIDIAIRIGRLPDSTLIARQLGSVPRVLVGAPQYFARHGEPHTPAELERHAFLFYRRPQGTAATFELQGPEGAVIVRPKGLITVNSIRGIGALLIAGRGLHLGPLWAFADALAAGKLQAIMTDYAIAAYPLRALYLPSLYVPAKIRRFVELMAAQVRDEAALSPP